MPSISVLIATRNRPDHVLRLVRELIRQQQRADEIIVVDASDDKGYQTQITKASTDVPIHWIDSEAHVCVQRNAGIRKAQSEWIFICDDDISIPENYLSEVFVLIEQNPGCGAACGLLMQKEGDHWEFEYPVRSFLGLLWVWIFQLPIWGTIPEGDRWVPRAWLRNYFNKRGNTLSKAGWPVLTDFTKPTFTTPYYALGACIVKREWLLQSPFDESLDSHGIGDNYGVIAGFPEGAVIQVTHATAAFHYRAKENRLDRRVAAFRRMVALHYFINTRARFPKSMRRWFSWSIIGRSLYHVIRGEFKQALQGWRVVKSG